MQESESRSLLVTDPDHPKPAPKGYDRLPLDWYKITVRRLRERVVTDGVDIIVIEDQWNIVYFSGNFMTKTERPLWLALPVDEEAVFWYTPGLDNELVRSWWCTDMNYYFDYHHTQDGYPDRGNATKGEPVDLFAWMLTDRGKKGFGSKTIGFD